MAKGLSVYVYRNGNTDCTNNGISANYDRFILVGDGIPEIFESSEHVPAVKLVRRILSGREYLHVEPLHTDGTSKWYMAGGNFVYTSDGRFPCDYPISIHDRLEW